MAKLKKQGLSKIDQFNIKYEDVVELMKQSSLGKELLDESKFYRRYIKSHGINFTEYSSNAVRMIDDKILMYHVELYEFSTLDDSDVYTVVASVQVDDRNFVISDLHIAIEHCDAQSLLNQGHIEDTEFIYSSFRAFKKSLEELKKLEGN